MGWLVLHEEAAFSTRIQVAGPGASIVDHTECHGRGSRVRKQEKEPLPNPGLNNYSYPLMGELISPDDPAWDYDLPVHEDIPNQWPFQETPDEIRDTAL